MCSGIVASQSALYSLRRGGAFVVIQSSSSTEGESVSVGIGVQKADLERVFADGTNW
ncbi:hypothetical protein [Cupriavidus necator]